MIKIGVMEELLEIVDKDGRIISIAPRSLIHGNPSMLHKVVHVLVFNSKGELLLQKRASHKDVAPGKWDTSVGGHIKPGEDILTAAKREMLEELGVVPENLRFLYTYIHSNEYESELVYTYWTVHEGPFDFNKNEVEEVAFWSIENIQKSLFFDFFSDNFKQEFLRYLSIYAFIPFSFAYSLHELNGSPYLSGDPNFLKNFYR
ncbi:NUDIX domain-containing protein [Thermodesulfovibrio sp. 3907-1M]|uniref:NUDIX domain-containing protein n=1 Tax=Thermodesulfovibrio autotrophicus TaxID=3118333 RepID=A0AAU8GTP7_9BACT